MYTCIHTHARIYIRTGVDATHTSCTYMHIRIAATLLLHTIPSAATLPSCTPYARELASEKDKMKKEGYLMCIGKGAHVRVYESVRQRSRRMGVGVKGKKNRDQAVQTHDQSHQSRPQDRTLFFHTCSTAGRKGFGRERSQENTFKRKRTHSTYVRGFGRERPRKAAIKAIDSVFAVGIVGVGRPINVAKEAYYCSKADKQGHERSWPCLSALLQ